MENIKSQPHYEEAKKSAIADIMRELKKEGKVFLLYNPNVTIKINNIIEKEYTEK